MAPERRISWKDWAAALTGAAALVLCFAATSAVADTPVATKPRILASELRITRGDLDRLSEAGLSAAHRRGLEARITGALGLLPWLVKEAGDREGADQLMALGTRLDNRPALARALDTLIARHPLDLVTIGTGNVSAIALLEARAIHQTYCSGCHDGTGSGDPDTELPIRDLFVMARAEPAEIFVARLYNGAKGDQSVGFVNPLTQAQFLALWRYYSTD